MVIRSYSALMEAFVSNCVSKKPFAVTGAIMSL